MPNLAERYQFRTLFITTLRGRPHDQELASTKTPGVSVDFCPILLWSFGYILVSSFYGFHLCIFVFVSGAFSFFLKNSGLVFVCLLICFLLGGKVGVGEGKLI